MQPINLNLTATASDNFNGFSCCFPIPKKKRKNKAETVSENYFFQKELDKDFEIKLKESFHQNKMKTPNNSEES